MQMRAAAFTSIACSSITLCPLCFDSHPFRKLGALDWATGGVAAPPQNLLGLLDCTPDSQAGQFLLGLLDCTGGVPLYPSQFLLGLLDCTRGLPQPTPRLLLGSVEWTRGLSDPWWGSLFRPHLPHKEAPSLPRLGGISAAGGTLVGLVGTPAETLVGLVGCSGGVDPGQSLLGLLGCTKVAFLGLYTETKLGCPLGIWVGPSRGCKPVRLKGDLLAWNVMDGLLLPGRDCPVMDISRSCCLRTCMHAPAQLQCINVWHSRVAVKDWLALTVPGQAQGADRLIDVQAGSRQAGRHRQTDRQTDRQTPCIHHHMQRPMLPPFPPGISKPSSLMQHAGPTEAELFQQAEPTLAAVLLLAMLSSAAGRTQVPNSCSCCRCHSAFSPAATS